MSLFERLINNKVKHATLDTQRRMRPEISKMMNLIYPELKNHECVTAYPSIKGLSKNVFFLDHKYQESSHELMQSKFNLEEARLVVRFVQYLLQNKQYKSSQITVLTLYTGQLLQIK